ncbi:MAG TPA: peptidoglycan editing factor PgeF [Methylomirabilota bacterium]|nr:peptidoglycan editing factor PgeF [Methylomirabilota bacterium]
MNVSGLIADGAPARYFRFAGLAALGLPHLTTTRHFPGVTPSAQRSGPFDEQARETLTGAGLDFSRLSYVRQVHGADVVTARPGGGFAGDADVLTTTDRGVPLAIFAADCLPIVAWDPDVTALAAAHVGWRGTVKGAQRAAVDALAALGARRARMRVVIGPSIGPCCYEVDEPVVADFTAAYGARSAPWMRPARPGHVMLDLWAANEALLLEAGVQPAHIENPRLCTACHTDLLYSYRMGHRGRLVTVAALP